jgi:glutaminyl-tRNA synthetase
MDDSSKGKEMNGSDHSRNESGAVPVPVANFIRDIIKEDLRNEKFSKIVTRFPPEPNGYLHIGHAKAICIDFGMANEFDGECHLRYDDTNPAKEEQEYIQAIERDVSWLGFDWGKHCYYASDYFDEMYKWAIQLINAGKAYVDDLTADKIREYRGTLTVPGKESPFRNRSVEENLDLFQRMENGEFEDGLRVLRAKIDMTHPNMNMRDPVMYRILKAPHHRTGSKWKIYPMYDWAHGLEDSIEKVTHSLCTLEFEDHRPLYDWFIDQLGIHHPQQIEFARLNLTYTVMSKRKLLELVKQKYVLGWDDPRMPTLSGLRRRGFTPEAIRNFCERIGVAKRDSIVDYALLEHCLREDLNKRAARVQAVINPLKVIIDNYPESGWSHRISHGDRLWGPLRSPIRRPKTCAGFSARRGHASSVQCASSPRLRSSYRTVPIKAGASAAPDSPTRSSGSMPWIQAAGIASSPLAPRSPARRCPAS